VQAHKSVRIDRRLALRTGELEAAGSSTISLARQLSDARARIAQLEDDLERLLDARQLAPVRGSGPGAVKWFRRRHSRCSTSKAAGKRSSTISLARQLSDARARIAQLEDDLERLLGSGGSLERF
jgi:uncharacterized protein YigA (DUF484 family)